MPDYRYVRLRVRHAKCIDETTGPGSDDIAIDNPCLLRSPHVKEDRMIRHRLLGMLVMSVVIFGGCVTTDLEFDRMTGTRYPPDEVLPINEGFKKTLNTSSAGARSGAGPALASSGPRLCLGWRGTNNSTPRLRSITSTNVSSWSGKTLVEEWKSDYSPALAFFNGRFYMAWTGRGASHHVNIISSSNCQDWSGRYKLGSDPAQARSGNGPALASGGGRVCLAWRGTSGSNPRLRTLFTTDGINWQGKRLITETTDHTPALAYFNGRFYLAWTGRDAQRTVNVISSSNCETWSGKQTLNTEPGRARSTAGPALAAAADRLYLAWRGTNDYIRVLFAKDGATWEGEQKILETTHHAPAMTDFKNTYVIAWTGTNALQHVNVLGLNPLSLPDVYAEANKVVTLHFDDMSIPRLTGAGDFLDDGELDTVMTTNRDDPVGPSTFTCFIFFPCTEYHVYGIVVDHYYDSPSLNSTGDKGIIGVMWSTDDRSAFAMFYRNSTILADGGKYFRSTAHELGHAFNLHHSDGDGSTTIMNQTGTVGDQYKYRFSAESQEHLDDHPADCVFPGTGSWFSVSVDHADHGLAFTQDCN